jgi:hypothetical protein
MGACTGTNGRKDRKEQVKRQADRLLNSWMGSEIDREIREQT